MSERNDDIFIDFKKNPEVASALNDKNAGDECDLELTIEIISKDSKGISAKIQPGSIVPEGYVQEEDDDQPISSTQASANQPPGYLGPEVPAVVSAMRLKKKGSR